MTILLACLLAAVPGAGQQSSESVVIGEVADVESRILGETRRIYVGTPPSSDAASQGYAVLYVLDGETQFQHTVTTARFLGGGLVQKIPPLIVVALGNTDRMRDMTPPAEQPGGPDTFAAQGGADRFLQFIAEELRPWIDERYPTNGYEVLIGHSLGGLFALHAFASEPDSFDGYIMLDPSLWWDDQSLVRRVGESLPAARDLDASLYLSISGAPGDEHEPIDNLVEMFRAAAPSGLRWQLAPIAGETHETMPLPAVYAGLQWVFADWDIEDQATGLFGDAPAEDILASIDDLYRQSGQRFSTERATPYFVFEALLSYLVMNGRLDEAADLTLRYADRYPLPLVPNVISGIAGLFVENGDEQAAIQYLSSVLELYPQNETAMRVLEEITGE